MTCTHHHHDSRNDSDMEDCPSPCPCPHHDAVVEARVKLEWELAEVEARLGEMDEDARDCLEAGFALGPSPEERQPGRRLTQRFEDLKARQRELGKIIYGR